MHEVWSPGGAGLGHQSKPGQGLFLTSAQGLLEAAAGEDRPTRKALQDPQATCALKLAHLQACYIYV